MIKKIKTLTVILLISFSLLGMNAHKFYISLSEFYYNKDAQRIEITVRVFIDDIEEAIKKQNNINMNITSDHKHVDSDKYIGEYLLKNINVSVNKSKSTIEYIGMEEDPDDIESIKCYLKIDNISSISQIDIENKILMELFDNQINMVKVRFYDVFRSFIQKKGNANSMLKL